MDTFILICIGLTIIGTLPVNAIALDIILSSHVDGKVAFGFMGIFFWGFILLILKSALGNVIVNIMFIIICFNWLLNLVLVLKGIIFRVKNQFK